ncbi:hypothetical protein GIB67_012504 [Kingdonia uniflora]|uniref:Nucleotide-diphospho-sugar transferase domain-containing protein n=1 Tax=Kingdonia uniflora TaxID=39325 RepID=A0A7J7MVB0_9MAGN|nr:hypothetical protein GIB67_012504 [Kingdonia uniflora]
MAPWYQTLGRSLFLMIFAIVIIVSIVYSSEYTFSLSYSSGSSPVYVWSSPSAVSNGSSPQVGHISKFSNSFRKVGGTRPSAIHQYISRPIWEVPPNGSKIPPLKTFRLTKELVSLRVKDNIIIVTFGNYAFMDFILTWVKHLTDLDLSNILVGAMDTKLLEALYWKGIPVFDMGSNMSPIDVGWGSPEFHKMGREKAILIDAILPFGYELLMCDTDMVWLKNPLPYFARFPEADILTSTDKLVPTVADDRLEIWQQVTADYNIGIFHWRPTDSAKLMAREWKLLIQNNEKIWDQKVFNAVMRKNFGPAVDEESELVYAYDGNLKLGFLPISLFCSGHSYFVQAMFQQLRLEPYAVHTTFQHSGTEGKRHRLREGMFFYDQPEYYDSPGELSNWIPCICIWLGALVDTCFKYFHGKF